MSSPEELKLKFLEVKLSSAVERAQRAEQLAMQTAGSLNSTISRLDDTTERLSVTREQFKELRAEVKAAEEESSKVSPSARIVQEIYIRHDVPHEMQLNDWVDEIVYRAENEAQQRAFAERKVAELEAKLARAGRIGLDLATLLPQAVASSELAEDLIVTAVTKRTSQMFRERASNWTNEADGLREQITSLVARLTKVGE